MYKLKSNALLTGLILILFSSCQPDRATRFTNLSPSQSGIDFKNTVRESPEFNVLNYGYFYNGGGVAIGDINNDGLADIYFTANMKASHLYLNKGDMRFENIAKEAGVEAAGLWNTGVTMADVNNDGWLDIYVCRSAAALPVRRKNLLFINNRNNTFAEMADEFGLNDQGYSTQAAFFDYDKDGDLDMYLLNHSIQEYAGFSRLLKSQKEKSNPFYGDKLYQNNLIHGELESFGRFTNVTFKTGIKENVLGFGLGLAIEDLNNDGWPDIYVSNDYNEEDYCYINNTDGTFTESIRDLFDGNSLFSMGLDIADINNDALADVMTLDMLPEGSFRQKMTSGADNFEKKQALYNSGFHYQSMRNMLQINNGNGSFTEIGQLAGVSNTDWSWASLFADYDNDGWQDIFVTNGYKADYTNMDFMSYAADQQIKRQTTGNFDGLAAMLAEIPSIEVPNYFFKNNADLSFENVTDEWSVSQKTISNGAAYGDLDNDGDLDLVVNHVNETSQIIQNNSDIYSKQNYLKVSLSGVPLNRLGFGTKVNIKTGSNIQSRTLHSTRGFQSSVEPVLHFGLGDFEKVDTIQVFWPDGKKTLLKEITANQHLLIPYDSVEFVMPKATSQQSDKPLLWQDDITRFDYTHKEIAFNEFDRQLLMPFMYSKWGPGLAQADINNDGRQDIFIGGGIGQSGQIFIQDHTGDFKVSRQSAFEADISADDIDAEFFDADGDGDMDLYVASGGSYYPNEDDKYRDRLYFNDGSGRYIKQTEFISTKSSSSAIVASDFDGDGDEDLFISALIKPGLYPQLPQSQYYQNNGDGTFRSQTNNYLPNQGYLGMLTDAIAHDYDRDSDFDIVIVGHWMPLKVLVNEGGSFSESLLIDDSTSGWWNTVEQADVDNDGDVDLIAGNFGSNSQWQATQDHPIRLFSADFDNNGTVESIISQYDGDAFIPLIFRDDLLKSLPGKKKLVSSYKDYAQIEISDLFTESELEKAEKYDIQMLSSVILLNESAGNYKIRELPKEAQFSPVFSILATDLNNDTDTDILVAGNMTNAREQLGRFTSHKGTAFIGDGTGSFSNWPMMDSGLSIDGLVRDMEVIDVSHDQQIIIISKNGSGVQVVKSAKD